MKKGKNIFSILLAALILMIPFGVGAQEDSHVFDDAGLFTDTEIQNLDNKIRSIENTGKWNYYIATTRNTGGRTARSYADDFYDRNRLGRGEDKSGVLFLIDMDNREAYISTCGAAVDRYSASRIERILDSITPKLSGRHYYSAASVFLEKADLGVSTPPSSAERAEPASDSTESDSSGAEAAGNSEVITVSENTVILVFILLLALAAGGIFFGVVRLRYRRKSHPYQFPLHRQSKLTLTRSEDRFINAVTHTRRIEPNHRNPPPGGTRPNVHRSSSGVRHGGGGKHF